MFRVTSLCATYAKRATRNTMNEVRINDLVERFNAECVRRHGFDDALPAPLMDLRKCLDKASGIAYGVVIAEKHNMGCRVSTTEMSQVLRQLETAVTTMEQRPVPKAHKIKALIEKLNRLD